MALALLTRADESLTAEWADHAPVAYGYEVLLVCDTSGDSPGTPWAVFCPSMDVVSAGRDPQDALDMIADAIYEALVDGVTPVARNIGDWLGDLYEEMVAEGYPMATAVVQSAPYSKEYCGKHTY
jgi:hypothetical protein